MQSQNRSYLREFFKSRSGTTGLVMLLILLGISLYAIVAIPQAQTYMKWENPTAWEQNPAAVPPFWVNYLGVDAPGSINLDVGQYSSSSSSSGVAYSGTTSFTWDHSVMPSGLAIVPNFSGTAYEVDVVWTKPDGNAIQIQLASPSAGETVGLTGSSVDEALGEYIQSQTGTYLSTVNTNAELSALFGKDGTNLLTNPVQQGRYTVTVQIVGAPGTLPTSSKIIVQGDSYGWMGTDSEGRPIDLGMVVGLPWALELGVIASTISVVGGILWGGLAGFYGGWRDKIMSWGTLVILATPALAFLIAISYSIQLTLLIESLLIAALSWPFFAIIARSVALSVRSQTYIEADRAMGIPLRRTFFTHILPRLTPVTVAFTALSVSGVIILAETLAFLGIEPGNVITWGGILNDAITFDASLHGWWWWTVFPGIMIFVASLPFVLIGFALDRIVAPRVSSK